MYLQNNLYLLSCLFHIHIDKEKLSAKILVDYAQKVDFMEINIRKAVKSDYPAMVKIWNEVVEDGIAFPQLDLLDENSGAEFFGSQTYCAVAENTESHKILGLYILHPNNVGRCGHICNASYAVKSSARNLHIGEKLVSDCLVQGKENGFTKMQQL